MSSTLFYIGRNDTLPSLTHTMTDSDGDSIDVSDATVTFTMVDSEDITTQYVLEQACTVLSGQSTGLVQYEWSAADTATAGIYLGQFEAIFNSGGKQTAPLTDSLVIVVMEDYDAN